MISLREPTLQPEPPADAVQAVLVTEVELSSELTDISGDGRYRTASVLVRLHGEPLGLLALDLPVTATTLREQAGSSLRRALERHLERDQQSELTPDAPCERQRRNFLEQAPPLLSVIIPSRERSARLSNCLDSIWASEYPQERYEVVVVDNDPVTSSTQDVVARHARTRPCRYVRQDVRGSASARNAGVAAARHELLIFTDDDVRVDPQWLTEVAQAFVREPEAAVVSGLLLPLELETPAQVWFEQYGGFSRGFERRSFDLDRHRPIGNRLYPFTAGVFGTGNNMAFRRGALDAIGGFDPALGNGTPALGGVDSEVLLRAVLRGYRVDYEPAALVHHQHRRDFAGLQRQVHAYGTGLSAYLLKVLHDNPRYIPEFLSRLPRGLAFAIRTDSGKNAAKNPDYPAVLTRLELLGMIYGPLAYLRSRRAHGRHVTRP